MKNFADLKGDGGSRVLEQVLEKQAEIKQRLSAVRHILAIGSGKGGVGKSTLTAQIGGALTALGLRVSLLDLDFNGPSLAKLTGVENAPLLPGYDGLEIPRTTEGMGVLSMGSLQEYGKALRFESVASNESHTWRATKEFSVLADILAGTNWGSLDYLLLDLPPGAERTFQFLQFFGPAVSLLLVSIPSELAEGVVARSLDAVGELPNQLLGYVENMSGYYCPDCRAIKPLFPVKRESSLELPMLAAVPFHPGLAELCDSGKFSLAKDITPIAKTINTLAQNILNKLQEHELEEMNIGGNK